jgi:hypothetical protein
MFEGFHAKTQSKINAKAQRISFASLLLRFLCVKLSKETVLKLNPNLALNVKCQFKIMIRQ